MVIVTAGVADQLAVLFGAIAGATAMGLIPYWAAIRNNTALGLPPITFDKKFFGTILIAIIVGIIAGFYYFNSAVNNIDTTMSVVQLFVTSAIASAISNKAINSSLSLSQSTTMAVQLKAQNQILTDELNVLKIKIAAINFPLKKEIVLPGEATASITASQPIALTDNAVAAVNNKPEVHPTTPVLDEPVTSTLEAVNAVSNNDEETTKQV